jgi:SAM-dependent methyltransferase
MAALSNQQDAYGHMLSYYWNNEPAFEVVEREDGYIDLPPNSPAQYFAQYDDWHEIEKKAIAYAKGRILDIGCGAGRVGLHLQQHGFPCWGIDNSPKAIEVCRLRGWHNVKAISLAQVNASLGTFETIVMFGNNFGLVENPEQARKIFAKFSRITSSEARIIATSRDVYKTENPAHLAYHEYNRQRGRMAGQIRLRIRFLEYKTPWFDYLMVSPPEMSQILHQTGWQITKLIQDENVPFYAAIIEKNILPWS